MRTLSVLLFATFFAVTAPAVEAQAQSSPSPEVQQLRQLAFDLERRVAALEQQNQQLQTGGGLSGSTGPQAAADLMSASAELRVPRSASALPAQSAAETTPAAVAAPALPGGATLNYYLDGYYEYNFNNPVGRANDLRAYDVLSNAFSIGQADLIFDLDPDFTVHRRYGLRIDLQYGQATQSSQGNAANEPRPDIYRNLFQAFGTYVVPLGSGLNVDFGKWASSLGYEGNYAKDQIDYTRSYFFFFLPFYHAGLRTSYKVDEKLTANYWLVNGENQTEPFNGYKDQLFGVALQPAKTVSWTINYYTGQENPDSTPASGCVGPIQPGLCRAPLTPAPNGRTHIFDSYATWQATPKLTLGGEGDYYISRVWANAAPGESSVPSHVDGGAAYVQYQVTPRGALGARTEYMSDPDRLFSGASQALKEATGTYKLQLSDHFDAFLEYRRDWSNRLYFTTTSAAAPASHQDTTALGLVWWYGGKQGSW